MIPLFTESLHFITNRQKSAEDFGTIFGIKPNIQILENLPFLPQESPVDYLKRSAKSQVNSYNEKPLLLSITIVSCGRRIMVTPTSKEQAVKMLSLLSGRRHQVYTIISVLFSKNDKVIYRHKLINTTVKIKRFTPQELEGLSISCQNNIGGYLDHPLSSRYISWVQGDLGNMTGLNNHQMYNLLKGVGFIYP